MIYPDFIGYNAYHKMRPSFLSIFALLAFAILLFTQAAAAPGPCDEADALREAKLFDKAEGAYIDLLANESSHNCSKSGLLLLLQDKANMSYEIGQTYENASQTKEAQGAYIEALKIDPKFINAEKALLGMNRNVINEIKSNFDLIYSILGLAIEPIVLLIIIILVAIAMRYKIYPWIKSTNNPRLDIMDFEKGATDMDIGKGLTPIIEYSIKNFGEMEKRPDIKVVTGPAKSLDIPVEVKTTQQLKILSELLEWAFPANIIELSGTLLRRKNFGDGIALTLTNSRTCEIIANEIIWERDFNPKMTISEGNDTSQFYRLAYISAIWAIFHFKKHSKKEECKPLGTSDWKSFAYYRSGLIWEKEGMRDRARQQYAMALNRDLRNQGALFNLSGLDIEYNKYEIAIEKLLNVKKYSEQDEQYLKGNIHKDPTWYKAMYQLAAAYQYLEEWENAEKNARELVDAIETTGKNLQKNEGKLGDFLASIRLEVNIMYAGALRGLEKIEKYEKLIDNCEKDVNDPIYSESGPVQNIYHIYYNLACIHSIDGFKTEDKEKKRMAYEKALSNLQKSFEIGGSNLKWAEMDPSLAGVRNEDEIEIKNNETAKKAFKRLIEEYTPQEKTNPKRNPL